MAKAQKVDPRPTPAGRLQSADEVARLDQAIRDLAPEQQTVILRFFEGLHYEEVGRRMGRTANAVRAIQFRALTRLRCLLKDEEREPSSRAQFGI